MFKAAGAGVAVGNADAKAKAVADYVAKEHHGLGVLRDLNISSCFHERTIIATVLLLIGGF